MAFSATVGVFNKKEEIYSVINKKYNLAVISRERSRNERWSTEPDTATWFLTGQVCKVLGWVLQQVGAQGERA